MVKITTMSGPQCNKISKKDCYPLPLISDLLDTLWKAHTFTKIDLCHTYHLVCIAEGEEWKTTFCTHYGSFKWLVMPFGLTNALTAFQWFMNDIFSDLLNVSVVIYLDDILIYSNNMSKHKQHVKEVLWRLQKHGLYANADKCEFHKTTMEFLGYILSPDGLFMDKTKVQTIVNWPELLWLLPYNFKTSVQVLCLLHRCFLGVSGCSCSRCFLADSIEDGDWCFLVLAYVC